MLPTIALPSGGLFEADVVRGDEVPERRRGMGDNAVGISVVEERLHCHKRTTTGFYRQE
jgi:hypothetical protein